MRELHVDDLCPVCSRGIMLGVGVIGRGLIIECHRCRFRFPIPPGPISLAAAKAEMDA